MSEKVKVVISGINGRFGRASARLIAADDELELVGAFGRPGAPYVGQDVATLTGSATTGILVSNEFKDLPSGINPDVVLDFSLSAPAFEIAKQALESGVRPVIGTSGVGEDHIKVLTEIANRKRLGAFVVPNFSVGAVLMMEFSKMAGQFFDNVEIVEMHHTEKQDAPSGTAMHTTKKLAENGKHFNKKTIQEHELLDNSRGGRTDAGVRVHSLRLPGLISHQEVIFGAPGELLTVRHDSFNTDCFLVGIKMAVLAVMQMDGLVIGLDKILNLNGAASKEKVGGRAS